MAEKAEIVLSAKDSTATAFQQVQNRLSTLKATLAGVAGGGAFAALQKGAELLADAFEKINPGKVFDAAEQLDKLSQRTGIAVEKLGALQFAGKLADVSTDELATSLKRLNVNIAAAARGVQEPLDAFKALGLSQKFLQDNVGDTDKILKIIADRFSEYKDGPNKVALANALAGKSFEKLIPVLNGGSKGIEEAGILLDKLGGTIDSTFAQNSSRLNDNLKILEQSSDSLRISLARGLVAGLADFSDEAVEAAKSGNKLQFAASTLYDILRLKPLQSWIQSSLPPEQVTEAERNVDALTKKIVELQTYLAQNPGAQGVVLQLQQLTEQLRQAQKAVDDQKAPGGINSGVFTRTDHDSTKVPTPRQAPPLPDPHAADNAQALLKKQLDSQIKLLEAGLEKERDLFQFADSRLSELYQHGDLSIEQFYASKAQAQQEFLVKQAAGIDAEIAKAKEVQAKLSKPQDREEVQSKINDFLAKQAKLYREAGQAAQVAATQEDRANEEAAKGLLELDAQIAELSGDSRAADLDRLAVRLADVRKQLSKLGDVDADPKLKERLESLRDLTDAQSKFASVQQISARITDQEETAEAAYAIVANRSGASRLETEIHIKELREGAIAQLDAQIAQLEQVTNKTEDQALAFEKLKLAREKAFDAKDPTLLKFREVVDQTGQSLATGLEDAIVDGKKLSDVFKAIEKDFLRLVLHDFLTTPLATSFTNFIKELTGIGGTQSGGLGGGDLFSGIGRLIGIGGSVGVGTGGATAAASSSDLEALFGAIGYGHGGGIAGSLNSSRMVNPGVFAHAQKYHGGGLAGDEVPAILRKREEILTEDDPRHRDNWKGGGGRAVNVTNHFHLQEPASRDTQSQVARRAGLAIQQALARG